MLAARVNCAVDAAADTLAPFIGPRKTTPFPGWWGLPPGNDDFQIGSGVSQ